MTDPIQIEPDLNFIRELTTAQGGSLKKCYQCATCSVACTLSHDAAPFPRKEMLYASWGLKDLLMGDPDIWLCHNCGDCSNRCPRGARPGDVLAAARETAIAHYSRPAVFNTWMGHPKYIPLLLVIPAIILLITGLATGWMNLTPGMEKIVYARFFSVELIELIFIPLSLLVCLVFFLGARNFIREMTAHYQRRGLVSGSIPMVPYLKSLGRYLLPIARHEKFSDCTANKNRKRHHMLVSFSFVSLAFVAGVFAFALYAFNSHAPYSQLNPVKILANVSGLALIYGSVMLILERLRDRDAKNSYPDWYLPGLALALGVSGMGVQLIRLFHIPVLAYPLYFVHLILAFNLVAFLPFSKLAHLVYRTVAMTFEEHIRSNAKPNIPLKGASHETP